VSTRDKAGSTIQAARAGTATYKFIKQGLATDSMVLLLATITEKLTAQMSFSREPFELASFSSTILTLVGPSVNDRSLSSFVAWHFTFERRKMWPGG
jgi:hypothetical protein